MGHLGRMYEEGCGVGKDELEAARWYRKAADAGNVKGMGYLGAMYEEGRGVGKDELEAVRWYRKAADAGSEGDSGFLGWAYMTGLGGLELDREKGMRLLRTEAARGSGWSAMKLKQLGVADA